MTTFEKRFSDPELSWSTLAGRFDVWWNDELLDWGRFRFHEPRTVVAREDDLVVCSGEVDPIRPTEFAFRFWARAVPWGLRMELQQGQVDLGLEEPVFDTLILTRKLWWEWYGDEVRHGGVQPDWVLSSPDGRRLAVYGDEVVADPGNREVAPGMFSLDLMLRPGGLLRGFDTGDVRKVQALGRAAVRVEAVPGDEDRYYRAARGLVALSADRYILDFDEETAILLDCRAFIAGIMASRHTISGLIVNQPLGKNVDGPEVPEVAADE